MLLLIIKALLTHISFHVGGWDKRKQTAGQGLKEKQLLQTAVGRTKSSQSSQSYEVFGET